MVLGDLYGFVNENILSHFLVAFLDVLYACELTITYFPYVIKAAKEVVHS